jgi:hypothetical protein
MLQEWAKAKAKAKTKGREAGAQDYLPRSIAWFHTQFSRIV